jgi:hypothetical protein
MPRQLAMWCACGRELSVSRRASGFCRVCQRRRRLSLEKFDGGRESAFARDGEACVVCGAIDDLVCHHRTRKLFGTLCRGDHARVHHIRRLRFGLPRKLKQLWRELHRAQPEQIEFSFAAESAPMRQAALFESAHG